MLKKRLQKLFIRFLVKHLYHAITAEDVLRINPMTLKPQIKFRGKTMDAEMINLLKENAQNFDKSLLWRMLENRIRAESQEKMFPLSSTDNDLLFGKAMLYNLDIIKQVLKEIKNLPS